MGFREETETLNRMTIQAVGGLLGLRLPLRGMVRCPFPDHPDMTPSFEVKASGNRWVCYGCNRNGGAIDLVKAYHGTEFLAAKRWLADRVKMNMATMPPRSRHTQVKLPAALSRPPTSEVPESPPDHEVYELLLHHAPLQSLGREYLTGRGLSQATISAFRIGQLSNCRTLLDELIRTFGHRRIESAGLLTKNSTARFRRLLFSDESLVFPFFEDGEITYLQVRPITNVGYRGKWRNLNHRRRRIYNVDALLETRRRLFAVCEGVMDTLSAIELGYNAIGLMGVSAKLTEEQIKQLRGKQVDILMDWDPAGEARAVELQKEMRRFGISSTRKRRPSPTAKDLNEYLMELKGKG